MRESHASILFKTERQMDPEIWDSIPDTTNAEEAMHWKLYSAAGKDQWFMDGMHVLYAVESHFHRQYTATISKFF